MSDINLIENFSTHIKSLASSDTVFKTLFCPYKLYESLKNLSAYRGGIMMNSHKCVFVYNPKTKLTEIEIVQNTYTYKVIRNIQNRSVNSNANTNPNMKANSKTYQSIDRLYDDMDIFTMCIESMFVLKIIRDNKDLGFLLRGCRRLAQTLNITKSSKKEYIHQCLSQIVRILGSINL